MNESRSIFFEMNRRVRDKWRGGGKEVGNIYIYVQVYIYTICGSNRGCCVHALSVIINFLTSREMISWRIFLSRE